MSPWKLDRVMGKLSDHEGVTPRVLVGGSMLVASVLLATGVRAGPVSFPGAEGYGANATGGRGGVVIHVTTTNDTGAGSFRVALTSNAVRTIVFDVGGTIDLQSNINPAYGNVTIAGQTAPGGIMIQGSRIEFLNCSNIVIRHLSMRGVHNNPPATSGGLDVLSFYGPVTPVRDVIVDHVSAACGEDEIISGNHAYNVTIQWCSMEQACRDGQGGTWHPDANVHNYGSLWGYNDIGGFSFHHNLMGNFYKRCPETDAGENWDIRNTVVYNWEDTAVQLAKDFATYPTRMKVNWTGNTYLEGPNSKNRKHIGYFASATDNYTVFFSDNKYVSYSGTVITNDNTLWNDTWMITGRSGVTNLNLMRVTNAIAMPTVTTHPVVQGYTQVLAYAGAYPFDVTRRQLPVQIATKTGGWGTYGPLEYFPYNTNGTTRVAMDTDRDGMPDSWETLHGLNPSSATDRNNLVGAGQSPGDRYKDYTWLEYYINEVADNLVPTPTNTYTITALPINSAGGAVSGTVVSVVGGWTPEWIAAKGNPVMTRWGTQQVYNAGSIVNMRALASLNLTVTNSAQAPQQVMATFSYWVGGPAGVDGSTNPVISFIADANYTLQAVFNASLSSPSVSLVATDPTATEAGPTTGQFTVSRGTNTSGTLIVNYTVGGTASNTADYAALSGNVTISNGMTHATIVVAPIDDVLREGDETVSLALAGGANYNIGVPSSGLVTLADDEPPLPVVTLAVTDRAATEEGPIPGIVEVGRGTNTIGELLVNYTIDGTASNGVDYVTLSGSVTIPNGMTNATIVVTPVNDPDREEDETVILTVAASTNYSIGTPYSDTVTISSDELPLPVVMLEATDSTASEAGSTTGMFTFSRGAQTLGDLDIYFAIGGTASNGADYVALTEKVTIPDGETFVATPVIPVDDTDQEGPETVTLILVEGAGYTIGTAGIVTVTIGDNDSYNAVTNGPFNAASTWDSGVGYPSAPGDWANIAGWTVTASNVGEVAEGVLVNLSAGGVLRLPDYGSGATWTNVIHSNATVNVNAGGLLWVGRRQVCNHSNVVNGGTLALPGGNGNPFGGVVTVAGDSVISNSIFNVASIYLTSAVNGGGKLTLKGLNSTSSDSILLASSTTWTGNWDVADGVILRFGGTSYSIPRGIRVGSGAEVRYNATATIKGTLSGAGTNKVNVSSTFTIGSSTNQGVVSPGDVGVNGGVGTLTLTSYTGVNYSPTMAFSSNSVYEVEMTGTSVYDRVTVVGTGIGTGKVTIAAGAVLNVTLWTPATNTTLDATIIDTVIETSGNNGLLTGSFSKVNWSNTAGWTGLVVTNIDNDLRVQGSYLAVVNPDANGNNISDAWETQYFGSTTNTEGAAEADWDKDGLNNYGEYVAGTIPTNRFSMLVFTNLAQSAGTGVILRWSSESNRFYTVRLSTNLLLDPFSSVLTNRMPGYPPENVHTDAVSRPGAFYQVTVTNQ